VLAFLDRAFQPRGRLDATVSVRRSAAGKITLTGAAEPKGMSGLYKWFPYPLEDVRGRIEFTTDNVVIRQVTGRRGGATMAIRGEVNPRKRRCYDLTVTTTNVRLDETLRKALPGSVVGVWEQLKPRGSGGGIVHVWRQGAESPRHADIRLKLDGKASIAYRHFPYRLDALAGEVHVVKATATLDAVRGRRGPMRCTLDGTFSTSRGGPIDLTIHADDLPLDANLLAALPAALRRQAETLHLSGTAERLTARVRQRPGEARSSAAHSSGPTRSPTPSPTPTAC
jgi:hypothetical protein